MTASAESMIAGSLGIAFFLIPLYPAFITLTGATVPGISLLPQPLVLAMLAFAATVAVSWAVLLLILPKHPMPTVLPLAAFPAAALVAAAFGFDPLAGALFIAILAGGVVWHATILRFAMRPGVMDAILAAYLISGAMASLAAIVMVLAKMPADLYTIGHGRAIGTFVLPGELAGYLIIYVPIAYAAARSHLRLRGLAWAGLALGACAFALTFSRAGWIGMAAAVAALVLVQRRGAGARYAIAIVVTALLVVLYAFNAHHDPSENFTRLSIWQTALRIVTWFPLAGVGPFDFPRLFPFVRVPGGEPVAYHAHNIVLTIAAETGLIGVVALFFGWWRFVAELRARIRLGSAYGGVSAAIAAGLIGTWVQGLIDTVSLVLFGLWLPFMALALVTAGSEAPAASAAPPQARTRGRSPGGAAIAAAAIVAFCCAYVQVASSAVYAGTASPQSFPAHLPPQLGARMDAALERVAPVPFVTTLVAEHAVFRNDPDAARRVTLVPRGPVRSDLEGKLAMTHGRTRTAAEDFIAAGDDEALRPIVDEWFAAGRVDDAYAAERAMRDRLADTETRPNALAESWWRLAVIAMEIPAHAAEAAPAVDHAIELAPLNTKYLLGAGVIALERKRTDDAARYFTQAHELDPMDADAIAGLALAALHRKDRPTTSELLARAESVNDCASLVLQLEEFVSYRSMNSDVSKSGRLCSDEYDAFNLVHYRLSVW